MDRSDPSCVSMKSDWSMELPPRLQEHNDLDFGSLDKLQILESPEPICVSMNSDQSLNLPPIQEKGSDFSPDPKCAEVLNTFRSNLQKKFQCLYEGTSMQRNPTLLNEIYTELYITESESGEISNEHEVRQIETQSRRRTTEETPIKCNDIFKPRQQTTLGRIRSGSVPKSTALALIRCGSGPESSAVWEPLPEQDKHIRSVLTKGVAGIGKTVSVQKFILDWAEEKENQDVHLIFPLPFREINLMKDKTLSLLDLLHVFFPQTKEMEIFSDEYKVLFIFDGLDECRLSLDFHSSVRLCDVSESTSVDVILTNLIKGNLFPSALIWITSRPAAADLIPSECVDRVTEVRGFSDPQKEEYFRKTISNESLSDQIISHLKSSRSLYIMCHIPVFCWISVTVLERMMSEAKSQEIPKTLTEMYTHFLIIQTNIKHQKDYEKKVKDEDMIFKLGKLAFEQLVKGNLIFYDEDLRDCGIDVAEASVYSGLCTQIFREEFGLYQGKVYCFVHLSIQEHLAALYVLYSFLYKTDLLNEYLPSEYANEFIYDTISDLHQRAVDKSLQSENGYLDLFLRFLLGLSLESNQKLLQDLLKHKEKISWSKEKTVDYIKTRIEINPKPNKSINLFHSLNELGDQSLVNEVQKYIQSGNLSNKKISSSQWSAVVFILLTSEQLDVFELRKYTNRDFNKDHMTSDEVLQKLLPVVEASRSAELTDCELSEKSCSGLTSVLTSKSSCLRDLNLSENKQISDSGVKLICDGLKNPNCKLETLKLYDCVVTDKGCAALASALRSNTHLRDLNLSNNKIRDSGVKRLSDGLKNPNCKLEKLKLWRCDVTDEGCAALASALTSNSHLRHLDLSNNKLSDSGVKLISDVLKNPNCKLEKLKLWRCDITDEGCAALASALTSNTHLRDLNLSYNNKLSDSGVKLICDVLKNPNCKLEKLKLYYCDVTDEGCAALASALTSNSHLRDLDLSYNKQISDSGKKLLSDLKKDSHYKLETLWI
nr:NACHT, LRR and PYD domains-containing protein 12-like isoform X2 [Misgurnus anguillicaudatus]